MKFKLQDYNDYNIIEILEFLKIILKIDSDEELLIKIGIKPNEDLEDNLEKIYQFAFDNNIDINNIYWQMDKEEFENQNHRLLCHGSRTGLIGNLRLDVSDLSNDFGNGFYCGEDPKQAGMFVSESENSSLYYILFNNKNLSKTTFTTNTNWMLAVAYFRGILGDYIYTPRIQSLANRITSSDYIIAPIADNRIFQLIDEFVAGNITDVQCRHALSATHLGYQYVFKTQKALDNLQIIRHCYLCQADKGKYNKEAEIESNTSLNKAILSKSTYKNQGKYIYEILGDNKNEI